MSTNPSLFSLLTAWSFDPNVVLGVVVTALIYGAGLRELSRRGRLRRSVASRHVVFFSLGLAAVVLALESPIDGLSDRLLYAHMIQHLLLLLIAPPLLLLGKPIPVLVVGAPRPLVRWLARGHARTPWFRGVVRLLTSPWFAWPAYVGNMLAWHLPSAYDAALRNDGVHHLEHLCFLISGILFWWVIIQPYPGRPRLAYGWRVLFILLAMAPDTALGMLFILDANPLYPFYAALPRMWGISVLDDQALAGNLMMIGGDVVMICAAIPLFAGMMERLEQMELARFARARSEE
ncbi:MAG TPA: cytochrome c oxidase assembly protein [Chloroflexota bacterium]|nr:cytochrome c oxidase assembly protein [Chloroflexota bacterium]